MYAAEADILRWAIDLCDGQWEALVAFLEMDRANLYRLCRDYKLLDLIKKIQNERAGYPFFLQLLGVPGVAPAFLPPRSAEVPMTAMPGEEPFETDEDNEDNTLQLVEDEDEGDEEEPQSA